MNSKVTLKDIADIAHVSKNSVSKALRDSPSISKEMKIKINKIAEELGYVKDVHALSLRGNRFRVVAIVYDNLSNPYYTIMLEKLHRVLAEKGYEAMIFVDHHSLGHLSEFIVKRIIGYGVSGVLTFLVPTNEAKKLLDNNHMPVVLIGRNGDVTNTPSIYSNDRRGGKIAAETLISLNSTNFCYITEHAELQINTERLSGFKNALQKNGYKLKKENIIVGNLEVNAYETLENLLKTEKIDGIFCFSDLIAFNVLNKLNELNYKVPEDINVIGYDNLKDYLPYPIKVSSIDPDNEYTAIESVKLLNSLIDNPSNEIKNIKTDVHFSKGTTTK